jgi:hypothetical protein
VGEEGERPESTGAETVEVLTEILHELRRHTSQLDEIITAIGSQEPVDLTGIETELSSIDSTLTQILAALIAPPTPGPAVSVSVVWRQPQPKP